ncbi:MAG: CRISPR-associated protein Csx15, partial [bacterium]
MSKIDMLMFYLEFAAMHLLNFAHPLTDEQKQKTEALLGQPLASIRHIPVQVDTQQPLAPQVRDMVENIDLSPKQWQSAPILWEYGQKQARQSGQAPSYQ